MVFSGWMNQTLKHYLQLSSTSTTNQFRNKITYCHFNALVLVVMSVYGVWYINYEKLMTDYIVMTDYRLMIDYILMTFPNRLREKGR